MQIIQSSLLVLKSESELEISAYQELSNLKSFFNNSQQILSLQKKRYILLYKNRIETL